MLDQAFGEIRLMLLDPLPVLGAGDPISAARWTLLRSKIFFQLIQGQFRCFTNRTLHKLDCKGCTLAKTSEGSLLSGPSRNTRSADPLCIRQTAAGVESHSARTNRWLQPGRFPSRAATGPAHALERNARDNRASLFPGQVHDTPGGRTCA